MGARRIRRSQRQVDMAESRLRNGFLKVKERARRDARMLATIKNGTLPFTPVVMSWLSTAIDKPSQRITPKDIETLLQKEASKPTKA